MLTSGESRGLPHVISRGALCGLVGLAIIIYVWLVPRTGQREDRDFSHLWLAGRMIVSGHADELYSPQLQVEIYRNADPDGRPPAVWSERYRILGCLNYPPPAALYYSFFAWLPFHQGALLNAYWTIVLGLAVSFLLARALTPQVSWLIVTLAVLLYYPFFANFALGQNAVVTMGLVVAAWYLCTRREEFWAGVCLGVLIFKPNWLVSVAWIPLVHWRWRMMLGMATGGAAIFLATSLVTGLEPFRYYFETQLPKLANLQELPGYDLELKYSSLGMFRKWCGVGALANRLGWACAGAVVLVTWLGGRGSWRPGSTRFTLLMSCSVAAALWLNPHLNQYDLLMCCAGVVVLVLSTARPWGLASVWTVLLAIFVYIAVPADKAMEYSRVAPLPSYALLLLWGTLAWRLWQCRSDETPRSELAVVDLPKNA